MDFSLSNRILFVTYSSWDPLGMIQKYDRNSNRDPAHIAFWLEVIHVSSPVHVSLSGGATEHWQGMTR